MRLKPNFFSSLFLTFAFLLSSVSFAVAVPEEGMFTPDQIAKLPLRAKGLRIPASELYNPNGTDISDAIIRLSIGCTAEFVSPKGLILTNHHCGFDALVSASTPQNDYGKTGYRAASMANELPAKGYSTFITNRVENVTAKILKGTENLTGDARAAAIKQNTDDLQKEEQTKAGASASVRIAGLNNGFFYYLYETTEIKDIRVVYAPHRDIGVFGGDPDNFEWTRHTGDYTFLRAYVAPDGKSAEYSPNNVAYTPKKFLTISLNGLKENDFVMVMGYPGGTTRYRESQFIDYSQNVNFPFLVEYLTAWSNALGAVGETDEAKRVALQSEIANIDNGRKLFEGGVAALNRSDFVDQRRDEEAQFTAWVNQNPQRKAKYGDVLANLKTLSKEFFAAGARDRLLRTFPKPTSPPQPSSYAPVYGQILDAVAAVRTGKKLDDKKRAEIEASFKDREPLLEIEMLKYFLKAAAELPADQKFDAAESLFGGKKGRSRREAEEKFAKSIAEDKDFDSAKDIFKLYDDSFASLQRRFPDIVNLAAAHNEQRSAYVARLAKYNADIDHLRLLYQQGMAEMKKSTPYPDANSTLRFTYGKVKGYSPREAVSYAPFTSLKGIIEKETGVYPFAVPQKLKDLQKAKDFGRYGFGDSVPVNFLATTDIIGGNSGSPIMNAYGEQVGIVFDGNYEGLGNDIFYNEDRGRTIAVDIRYVLFVAEKVDNMSWILNEMTIKKSAVKRKKAGA